MQRIFDIDEYLEETNKTAIYPYANSRNLDELMYLGLGLGEAGEIQGKIKKLYRDSTLDKEVVAKEVGDLFWYAVRLCKWLGYDPSQVLAMNIEKLTDRKERNVIGGNGDNR